MVWSEKIMQSVTFLWLNLKKTTQLPSETFALHATQIFPIKLPYLTELPFLTSNLRQTLNNLRTRSMIQPTRWSNCEIIFPCRSEPLEDLLLRNDRVANWPQHIHLRTLGFVSEVSQQVNYTPIENEPAINVLRSGTSDCFSSTNQSKC